MIATAERRDPSSLRVSTDIDADRWNAIVAGLGGNIFHNAYYLTTLYHPAAQKPFIATSETADGRTIAACAGLVTNVDRRPWMKAFPAVHLAAYPAAADAAVATATVGAVADAMNARGCIALSIDGLGARDPELPDSLAGAQLAPRAEFRMDLTRDLDELQRGVAKTRRAAIRRAASEGLALRVGRDLADLMTLRGLMRDSSARASEHTGEAFAIPSEEKLRSIAVHLLPRDLAAVYIAELNGVPVSASVIATWNRQAYNLLAGSSAAGFKIGAASWLYWQVIETLKTRGFVEFNLGGVDPTARAPGTPGHGLFDFKRDFGGDLVKCPNVLHVMRPARFRWYQRFQRVAGRAAGAAA